MGKEKLVRLLENTALFAMLPGVEFAFGRLRRNERSGILIGAGGMRRSDWTERL